MPNISPLKFHFRLNNLDADEANYVDEKVYYIELGLIGSMLSRRNIPQGMIWPVTGFELVDKGANADGLVCRIGKLQDTWPTNNAWVFVKSLWDEQQMSMMEDSESTIAKYRDFKILMDTKHNALQLSDGAPTTEGGVTIQYAYPHALNVSNEFLPGEWQHSEIVLHELVDAIPPTPYPDTSDGVEYNLVMYGDDTGDSKGILKAYVDNRSRPFSPDPNIPDVADSWVRQLSPGYVNDKIVENATEKNNDTPYLIDQYPGQPGNGAGAALHDEMRITSTTVSGTDTAPGGIFQCGLIRIDLSGMDNANAQTFDLCVQVMPDYDSKFGYSLVPMEEF